MSAHDAGADPTPGHRSGEAPSSWNLPNALTVLRILMVPVFVWLLLRHGGHTETWRWAALGVFVLAAVTDRLDGQIARSRGLVTTFGKIADPIADKALMGAGLVGLSLLGDLPWWVTVVILVREVGITLMRFAVIRHGVMPAGRGGKLKTVLQAVALGGLIAPLEGWPHTLAWVVMLAAVAVTVLTGLDYLGKAYVLRRDSQLTARRRAERDARA